MLQGKPRKETMLMPCTVFVLFGDENILDVSAILFVVVSNPMRKGGMILFQVIAVIFGSVDGKGAEEGEGVAENVFPHFCTCAGDIVGEFFFVHRSLGGVPSLREFNSFASYARAASDLECFAAVGFQNRDVPLISRLSQEPQMV